MNKQVYNTRVQEIQNDIYPVEYYPNKKIGLVALRTDHLIEDSFKKILSNVDVSILTNRIEFNDPVNEHNLQAMKSDLDLVVTNILPGKKIDVVAFGCSSGAVAIGEKNLEEKIKNIKKEAQVTNPVTAAIAAFNTLNVKKISVITPYIKGVNEGIAQFFNNKGIEVLNIAGFSAMKDADITRISQQAIKKAALELVEPEAEAVFLSCTALRAIELIDELEETLGIPVITSNQALAWHALRLLGNETKVEGFGNLFYH